MIAHPRSSIQAWLWDPRWDASDGPASVGVRILRYPWALIRDVVSGGLNLRAMSLVYTTLLSIVPLLALIFAVLKGLNMHRRLEPTLVTFLEPLGTDKAVEITGNLIEMVDNIQGSLLGGLGLLFLFYTVLSMIQKVESSFNFAWQVEHPRSFARRFSEYVSVLVIGPALMVISLGLIASVTSNALVQRLAAIEPFGQLIVLAGKLVPYFMVIAVFTFLYAFIPNTRVRFRPALTGGLTAGVMWAATSAFFASFIANSTSRTAVYGTFAGSIVALIWIYLNWVILLVGAQLSFYIQNPDYLLTGRATVQLSNRLRETVALEAVREIGRQFREGARGPTVDELASTLQVAPSWIVDVLDRLEERELIRIGEGQRMVPGREPDRTLLSEVVDAVRQPRAASRLQADALGEPARIVEEMDRAIRSVLTDRTVRDLVETDDPPKQNDRNDRGQI